MKTTKQRCNAGLVFLSSREADILEYCEALQHVLETTNQRICAVNILSERLARVSTDSHHVEIEMPREPAAGSHADRVRQINRARLGRTPHLVLNVTVEPNATAAVEQETGFDCEALLAAAICHLIRNLGADYVLWLKPDAMVDAQKFVNAISQVAPRRVQKIGESAHRPERPALPLNRTPATMRPSAQACVLPEKIPFRLRFPDVEVASFTIANEYDRRKNGPDRAAVSQGLAHEDLHHVFHDDPNDMIAPMVNTSARLATWAVALTVMVFSLPIGAFVLVINLLRGEDFRLSAQAMSLTGLMVSLNTTGASARALALIGG